MIDFPKSLTAGDSMSKTFPAIYVGNTLYSPSEYDLKIILRGVGVSIDLVGSASLNSWLVNMTPAQSAKLTAGTVKWVAIAFKGNSERTTLGSGVVVVHTDLQTAVSYDPRTLEQIELEALKKAFGAFTSSGGKVQKYTIGNRQMEFVSLTELTNELHRVQRVVAHQLGLNTDKYVRFTNAV